LTRCHRQPWRLADRARLPGVLPGADSSRGRRARIVLGRAMSRSNRGRHAGKSSSIAVALHFAWSSSAYSTGEIYSGLCAQRTNSGWLNRLKSSTPAPRKVSRHRPRPPCLVHGRTRRQLLQQRGARARGMARTDACPSDRRPRNALRRRGSTVNADRFGQLVQPGVCDRQTRQL
jgi:hypothetical protein